MSKSDKSVTYRVEANEVEQISPRSEKPYLQHEDSRLSMGAENSTKTPGSMAMRGMSSTSCDNGIESRAFEDPEKMKENARKCAVKEEYDVKKLYHDEGYAQKFARHSVFELATTVLIGLNSIWIWIDADYNDKEVLTEADWGFQLGEHFFCFFFFLEWLVRFCAFRNKRDCLTDGWFIFDTVLVGLMVFETWVMTVVLLCTSQSSTSGLGNASILRLLRLMRLTRISRMARLLRAMPELLFMIKGIVAATRSVFFTMLLLVFVLYVFAIMCRQLSDGTEMGKMLFPSVWSAMGTLIIEGALLDSPGDTINLIAKESTMCTIAFGCAIFLACLTIMNMLVGVLCEVVSAVAAAEKETLAVTFVKSKIQEILKETGLQCDNNHLIDKDDFEQMLKTDEVIKILLEVGVDIEDLVDYAEIIFQSDREGKKFERKLEFEELVDLVLQLRSTNDATLKDVSDLRKFILSQNNNRNRHFADLEQKLKDLTVETRKLTTSMNSLEGDIDWLSKSLIPVLRAGSYKQENGDVHNAGATDAIWQNIRHSNLMKSAPPLGQAVLREDFNFDRAELEVRKPSEESLATTGATAGFEMGAYAPTALAHDSSHERVDPIGFGDRVGVDSCIASPEVPDAVDDPPEHQYSKTLGENLGYLLPGSTGVADLTDVTQLWKGQHNGETEGRFLRRTMTELEVDRSITRPNAMFADADEMKKNVRKTVVGNQYNVKEFYHSEGFWPRVAKSARFELLTLAVIGLNSIWLWIDSDLNDQAVLIKADWYFQLGEHLFCTFFSFEWTARFLSFRDKRNCLKDAWFVFDSVMVALMVFETWIMTIILLASTREGGGLGNTSVLRLLRLMRLTRISRLARLLRAMPELLFMIKGMLAATRGVFFTIILLLFIIYVFGIVMRLLSNDTELGRKQFPSVHVAMAKLIIHGTLLDNVGPFMNELTESSRMCAFAYALVIVFAALTMMNMLVGVLCEVVSAVAATEKEELSVSLVKNRIETILRSLYADSDECENGEANIKDVRISKEDFATLMGKRNAVLALKEVGVDAANLIDFADAIFQSDAQGTTFNKKLSFADFMVWVLELRDTNNATVKDITNLRKFIHNQNTCRNVRLQKLDDRISYQEERTSDILEHHQSMERKTKELRTVLRRALRPAETSKTVFTQELVSVGDSGHRVPRPSHLKTDVSAAEPPGPPPELLPKQACEFPRSVSDESC